MKLAPIVSLPGQVQFSHMSNRRRVEQSLVTEALVGRIVLQDPTQAASKPFVDGQAKSAFRAGKETERKIPAQ